MFNTEYSVQTKVKQVQKMKKVEISTSQNLKVNRPASATFEYVTSTQLMGG